MAPAPLLVLIFFAGFAHALPPLEDAIKEAVTPLLKNRSAAYNDSAWGFSYVDATTRVSLCAGYSDRATRTLCSVQDMHAWGSTTKVQTAVLIMKLIEQGTVSLDDSIVTHADSYVQRISQNSTSLVSLFGPQIHNVTIRHLLQMMSGIAEYDNKILRHIQNVNRSADLDPLWILKFANRTFMCAPGSCASYSSTNYVILGLVLANYGGASNWDKYDQRSWIPSSYKQSDSRSSFNDMYYPVHGMCSNFSSADASRTNSTMHGYQKEKFAHDGVAPGEAGLDVYTLSCLQGWTCGNLVSPTISVADFFWTLLGPPSRNPATALLKPASMVEMLSFKNNAYLGSKSGIFGYGLGMMNFTSMNWGFEYDGLLYGHNGLTYGFGAQSGYHLDLEFAVTWNNNAEHWIGPDMRTGSGPNTLYKAIIDVVKQYRSSNQQTTPLLV